MPLTRERLRREKMRDAEALGLTAPFSLLAKPKLAAFRSRR
jgi:hypothetical protein